MKLTYGSGLGEGISSLGKSIGNALKERAEKARIAEIMKEMPTDTTPTPSNGSPTGTTLSGVTGSPEDQTQNAQDYASQPEPVPVAEQVYNKKLALINYRKKQAQALQQMGKHQEAQMMMQEAHQQETMLQQEHLQDKKLTEKISSEQDKKSFEENKPYYSDLNKKRGELSTKQATLLSIRDNLINSGGNISKLRNLISTFAPFDAQDYIKDANAQQLASFVKDFFVADLKGMPGGSKLNQLIEKNLLSALQSPGKTEESNQKITEFQQYKLDIIEKELEIADRLKDQYLKVGREPPRNFQENVQKQLKPYVLEKQRELVKTYKNIDNGQFKSHQALNMPFLKEDIKETPPKPGYTWIASPKGKAVQVPTNELDKWLNGGGKIIK